MVRLTVPHQADADNLKHIRSVLKQKKIHVPLVADIHFLPKLALQACDYVEKVRVNPGNFADRKKFEVLEYSDADYALELERIADAFLPIVLRAQKNGIAMRIGTNHGSLSDRIMNRYGDTPEGMVASAIEFVDICRGENYHNLVISMKSSNPFVMVSAYRMLAKVMREKGYDYPLHLGVTEAGDGQDGRIKSSVGIATLLQDGLGDTIRVSLTEDPEKEIPVAQAIADGFAIPIISQEKDSEKVDPSMDTDPGWNPYVYQRRHAQVQSVGQVKIGEKHMHKVWTHGICSDELSPHVELICQDTFKTSTPKSAIQRVRGAEALSEHADAYSLRANPQWLTQAYKKKLLERVGQKPIWFRIEDVSDIEPALALLGVWKGQAGLDIFGSQIVTLTRKVVHACHLKDLKPPLHICFVSNSSSKQTLMLKASGQLGALLCDGIGDSIEVACQDARVSHDIAFGILQATRLRMSRADYISCPSCGRTLFDLQSTTQRIREKTNHLKGVKIAIMGCIVNGPGEMADADFGYVGSGPGKINLFVGKTCVEKNIDQAQADHALIKLIKSHGRWHEPTHS